MYRLRGTKSQRIPQCVEILCAQLRASRQTIERGVKVNAPDGKLDKEGRTFMTAIDSAKPSIGRQPSTIVQFARYAYLLTIVLYMVGIGLQVFFAGAALMVDSSYLIAHRSFAHALHLVTYG